MHCSFIAPEVRSGEGKGYPVRYPNASCAMDIWSLGMTYYVFLKGKLPIDLNKVQEPYKYADEVRSAKRCCDGLGHRKHILKLMLDEIPSNRDRGVAALTQEI